MDVSVPLTLAFVAIVAAVSVAGVALLSRAASLERDAAFGRRVALLSACALAAWMGAHALIAESGVLVGGPPIPPRMSPYLLTTTLACAAFSWLAPGRWLATHTPIAWLIGFHSFRLPLEFWLHTMHSEGIIPIQMTWSGWNFDVVTGVSAIAVAGLAATGRAPRWLLWAWNVLGSTLLAVVVVIAVTSAPTAMRLFTQGPSLDLGLHAPFNWIASVLVMSAFIGHVVVFRHLCSTNE